MYADNVTAAMKLAIDETNRRREKQVAYNEERGVDPQPLRKRIGDITEALAREGADTAALLAGRDGRKRSPDAESAPRGHRSRRRHRDSRSLIADLNEQMLQAAGELEFELAARLRDELSDSRRNSVRWRPRDTCADCARPSVGPIVFRHEPAEVDNQASSLSVHWPTRSAFNHTLVPAVMPGRDDRVRGGVARPLHGQRLGTLSIDKAAVDPPEPVAGAEQQFDNFTRPDFNPERGVTRSPGSTTSRSRRWS